MYDHRDHTVSKEIADGYKLISEMIINVELNNYREIMYKYLDGFPVSEATAINRATDPLNELDDRSTNSPLSLISKDLRKKNDLYIIILKLIIIKFHKK